MKNKIYIYAFFFLLFPDYISAQEQQLDEDFLKSLPTNIRNDFIKEMEENQAVKDEIYTAPKTSIDTLESNLEKIQ